MHPSIPFLKSFNHKKYTLCTLSSTGMRSFPCASEKLEKAIPLLQKENEKGSEIYFMVNEGDGVLNDKKTACHSTNNVINLSSIFLDAELSSGLDPLPHINDFCEDSFVSPSLTVKTSPNRHHVYWLLDPLPPTKENVTKWKRIQAFLHSKLSSDRTMTDIPQILRIPGFQNIKKNYFVSTDTPEAPTYYSLDELYSLLLKHFPTIQDFKAHSPLPPLTPDLKIEEGDRHVDMVRRMRRLFSDPMFTLEDGECWINGYINRHIPDNKQFLNGNRVNEVKRIVQSCYNYAEEERQKSLAVTIEKVVSKKKDKSPFELDPDFYYQAPGPVGELTRHIVDTSNYPIPSHAFAAAVSLFGFMKARYIQGERSLPPLNYFLCLAPSGAGKTTIQTIFKEIMGKVGVKHLLEDGISSAQGLIQFLSQSQGLGVILYDEVKDLFQTIQSKRAATYETKIATELTRLYTAYSSSYTPPTTKTQKGKKVTLEKPLFSFLGYGHHTLVEHLFTKDNVIEGLIPRFIILAVNQRKEIPTVQKSVPSHIIDLLRYHSVRSCLVVEESLSSSDHPEIELVPDIEVLPLSPTAIPFYKEFKSRTATLYDHAVQEKNGLEALFSRGCEQSLRLSLAMTTEPHIDRHTLEFTSTLIMSQMQEFHTRFDTVINQTRHAKSTNELYEKIVEFCSESSDYTISRRDLHNRVRRRFENRAQFQNELAELIDLGKVAEFEYRKPSGQKEIRIKIEQSFD